MPKEPKEPTMMTTPTNKHRVLLSVELEVEGGRAREAQERAQQLLAGVLEDAMFPDSVTLSRPVGSFSDAAWLALQLLALEERGEKAAARVARLRAEVEAELNNQERRAGHLLLENQLT